MKISDYMLHNRISQGHLWTIYSTRMSRLEKTIPRRVYYANDYSDLEKLMSLMMEGLEAPTVSMDQAIELNNSNIKDMMNRLPESRCAVIMNESCNEIKEIILASRHRSEYGLTPLFRVRWNQSSKSFVSERSASEAYINEVVPITPLGPIGKGW